MANEANALTSAPTALREEDYRSFCAAIEASARGRDFLAEYARRNRHADTEMLLAALDRMETLMRADGKSRDRLRDELRVLLIAIRLARPDIDSASALSKAAKLVNLLDLMERRIDAMVENNEILPEPQAPELIPLMLAVVPRPDEPELPIPSPVQPPAIVLVQEVKLEPVKQPPPKQHTPKQDTAIQALANNLPSAIPSAPSPPFTDEAAVISKAPEEKWLPDFGGDEAQIIHTKPVRSMAFMPEVMFDGAAVENTVAAPAIAQPIVAEPEQARIEIHKPAEIEAPAVATPAPKPELARLRDNPLAAIMALSEEERIALFT